MIQTMWVNDSEDFQLRHTPSISVHHVIDDAGKVYACGMPVQATNECIVGL